MLAPKLGHVCLLSVMRDTDILCIFLSSHKAVITRDCAHVSVDNRHTPHAAIWELIQTSHSLFDPRLLTLQLEDGVMRSAVHCSDGIPSAVVPQTLEYPGGSDDRGRPAGCPPFIGDGGTNRGSQSGQAAEQGQNLDG